MKKIFLAGLMLTYSFQAIAEIRQIELLKNVYEMAKRGQYDNLILSYFGDEALKKSFKQVDKYHARGKLCLDHSPIWNGQDFDDEAKISYRQISKNRFEVTALHWGSHIETVIYVINCNAEECYISDVFNNGTSLKQHIAEACY